MIWMEAAVETSGIVVTAAMAASPLIEAAWVRPGTHLSCMGADMPGKQEIAPAIIASARLFTDDTATCASNGEIERGLAADELHPNKVQRALARNIVAAYYDAVAAEAAEAQLRQWAATEGKYLTGRFSPGYGDWDIAVQPLVAAALDTVRKAGLCVTDTNLMTPRKSVTALLGVSDHPVKGQLAGCGHCVLRTRCEYRKRGKTCASE